MTHTDPPAAPRMCFLVIEAGADPADGKGPGRGATPLHEAGTPALDRLARDGHLHRVVLGAATCWDGFGGLIGADPGTAPLAAAEAANIGISGSGWAACADFVTVDDSGVLDPLGGHVADPEAGALLKAAESVIDGGQLVRLRGNCNLWISSDAPEHAHPGGGPRPADAQPRREPVGDARARASASGAPHSNSAPAAPTGSAPAWQAGLRAPRTALSADPRLVEFYDATRSVLGQADINAVRVDLGENPANALWPHGGGRFPLQMTPPVWAEGRRVALVAAPGAALGAAKALGWHAVAVDGDDDALCAAALAAFADHDVVVVRTSSVLEAGLRVAVPRSGATARADAAGDEASVDDLHDARVQAFASVDARLASPILGALEERGPFVFAVAADGAVDLATRAHSAEPLPCGTLHSGGLGSGGGSGAGLPAFNERACVESGHRVEGAAAFAALLAHEFEAVSRRPPPPADAP